MVVMSEGSPSLSFCIDLGCFLPLFGCGAEEGMHRVQAHLCSPPRELHAQPQTLALAWKRWRGRGEKSLRWLAMREPSSGFRPTCAHPSTSGSPYLPTGPSLFSHSSASLSSSSSLCGEGRAGGCVMSRLQRAGCSSQRPCC